jgi:hypothetical protein
MSESSPATLPPTVYPNATPLSLYTPVAVVDLLLYPLTRLSNLDVHGPYGAGEGGIR